MKLPLAFQVLCSLCFAITATLAVPQPKPNCQAKCGNITIPFPFGIGSECSANSSFTAICLNSTNPPKLILRSMNLEILHISLYGAVIVNQAVVRMNCFDEPITGSLPLSLKGSPFTISPHYNSLLVMGCKNSVWSTVGGCRAVCDANSTYTNCTGVNCCKTTIPTGLQELLYTYRSIEASNSSFCGYVFLVDKKWLQDEDYKRYRDLLSDMLNPLDQEFEFAPLVLEWEFDTNSSYCHDLDHFRPTGRDFSRSSFMDPSTYCRMYHDLQTCRSLFDYYSQEYRNTMYYTSVKNDHVSSIRYCSCGDGFEGNPYTLEGYRDIDECSNATLNNCRLNRTCFNTLGSFSCHETRRYYDEDDHIRAVMRVASIVIGSVLGVLIILTAAWKFGRAIAGIIKASRKYMFFKKNGGLLFEQQMAALENGLEKTKLFSSDELAKATDDYNESRIIGRGGEGIVYKGMLEDGRIVAVKKSQRVNQGDVEGFINEVLIVSQINHRNIVKLLGCCLESEVPHLVYEFISNGTLFHHIHDPHDDFPLFWEMRVRIAKEVAGALAYLHSSASAPIYHRDIKSTNILLDEKYRAKISDFGTSRSVRIDQTHVTTRVVGTFGYLDPEYFQLSQFTEKSDVYSFGVVLLELLTGEKAISAARVEEGRGLAMHFLHSMEENHLFDILDARVLTEGKREEIEAMAEIARKCLHLNGKSRPTMKEVARDLEAIQLAKEESDTPQNQIESSGCNSNKPYMAGMNPN